MTGQRTKVKKYSQTYFYVILITLGLPLINGIIILLLQPTVGNVLHSGLWELIGANVIFILYILYLSRITPFTIYISPNEITVFGFIYKYPIRKQDMQDIKIINGRILIKPKNNKKFKMMYADKDNDYYKILGFVRIDDAFIDAVKFFLPLNPKIEIDWDYVPPKYKDKLREVIYERQEDNNG